MANNWEIEIPDRLELKELINSPNCKLDCPNGINICEKYGCRMCPNIIRMKQAGDSDQLFPVKYQKILKKLWDDEMGYYLQDQGCKLHLQGLRFLMPVFCLKFNDCRSEQWEQY